jgi:hypothetical protein
MTPVQQRACRNASKGPRKTRSVYQVALLAFALTAASCDGDGGTIPNTLRFGQVGEIEVELHVPLRLGAGALHQTLRWSSSGAWTFQETIAYRGLVGDETFQRTVGDPSPLAGEYASFITQINDVQGIQLDIPDLPQELDEPCGATTTRIEFTIRDEARGQQKHWARCADGSLPNISPVGAGPDPAASRVVLAIQLARNRTVGEGFLGAYNGSVPFGTLDRGENTTSGLTAPAYVVTDQQWQAFWVSHRGAGTPPQVDFENEIVVVAAVGAREEAGDSVEVRRVLEVGNGTLTEVYERVPGDFCTPAARSHTPFHIVVAPRTPSPTRFADIRREEVSCGG